jgi:hypothetical protein
LREQYFAETRVESGAPHTKTATQETLLAQQARPLT